MVTIRNNIDMKWVSKCGQMNIIIKWDKWVGWTKLQCHNNLLLKIIINKSCRTILKCSNSMLCSRPNVSNSWQPITKKLCSLSSNSMMITKNFLTFPTKTTPTWPTLLQRSHKWTKTALKSKSKSEKEKLKYYHRLSWVLQTGYWKHQWLKKKYLIIWFRKKMIFSLGR